MLAWMLMCRTEPPPPGAGSALLGPTMIPWGKTRQRPFLTPPGWQLGALLTVLLGAGSGL